MWAAVPTSQPVVSSAGAQHRLPRTSYPPATAGRATAASPRWVSSGLAATAAALDPHYRCVAHPDHCPFRQLQAKDGVQRSNRWGLHDVHPLATQAWLSGGPRMRISCCFSAWVHVWFNTCYHQGSDAATLPFPREDHECSHTFAGQVCRVARSSLRSIAKLSPHEQTSQLSVTVYKDVAFYTL